MKLRLLGRSLSRWCFFNVGLALLQMWVLIAFRWLRNEDIGFSQVLLDGSLIFYANSLSMTVMERRLDELRLVSGVGDRKGRDHIFWTGTVIPFITLMLSVTIYCALLSSPKLTSQAIVMEFTITALALMSSVTHTIEVWKRFEEDFVVESSASGKSSKVDSSLPIKQ